jgi:hypothetical protein
MVPKALAQATQRLAKVRAEVERMQTPLTFSQFEDAWAGILMASGVIYSKLEQGAKNNGKSAAWFGRLKHVRRTDELLRYIHHARNAEQHGIDNGAQPIARRVREVIAGDGYEIIDSKVGFDHGETSVRLTETPKPGPIKINAKWTHLSAVRLTTVKDELHGDLYDPPTSHLGKPLSDRSPKAVAEAALAYLTALIHEASLLP